MDESILVEVYVPAVQQGQLATPVHDGNVHIS